MAHMEEQCWHAHNRYRKLHNAPELQMNKQLSAYAKEWAEKLAKDRKMQHRSNPVYGENIFMSQGKTDISGEQVVEFWYNEIRNYDFNAAIFTPDSGHFTQVVWKSARQLGVGAAYNDNMIFVVCNYEPYGNVFGKFKENVLPLVK